jgi:hypothetical protein
MNGVSLLIHCRDDVTKSARRTGATPQTSDARKESKKTKKRRLVEMNRQASGFWISFTEQGG